MLSYEKALELKEAGYWSNGIGYYYLSPTVVCHSDHIRDLKTIQLWQMSIGGLVYIPTLEELIKNLPDHCGLQRGDSGWCMSVKGFLREETVSDDPSESVANLWLILNKITS